MLPNEILEQWSKPVLWSITQQKESIEISDENDEFVMSSVTNDHVSETIEDHLKKIEAAATLELLLSISDNHEA